MTKSTNAFIVKLELLAPHYNAALYLLNRYTDFRYVIVIIKLYNLYM